MVVLGGGGVLMGEVTLYWTNACSLRTPWSAPGASLYAILEMDCRFVLIYFGHGTYPTGDSIEIYAS